MNIPACPFCGGEMKPSESEAIVTSKNDDGCHVCELYHPIKFWCQRAEIPWMQEGPVMVLIEETDLKSILTTAQECAEDLQVAIRKTISGSDSVSIRHRDRAMTAAGWLLSSLPSLRTKYGVRN